MSDMGAEKNPDLNLATEITKVGGFLNLPKTNVMQWGRDDGLINQKYANKSNHSNVHILINPDAL